jgi:hypothetical protein
MNAIQTAIAEAQKAAATIPAGLPAVPEVGNTAVAAYQGPGRALTLDDMMVGNFRVDAYLKVNQFGMQIGNNQALFQTPFELGLDMSEIAYNQTVKFGNPVVYLKSYDLVSCATGGSWAAAIERAQRIDPKARPYRSADLPFVVLTDIKAPDGTVILEAGKRLGHSVSTTGWNSFDDLVKKLRKEGNIVDIARANLKVKVGFEAKSNPSGKWGVLLFLEASELLLQ